MEGISFPHYMRPRRILPACDWCYFKKTRCDRNQPCHNCLINGNECLRERQRTSSEKSSRRRLKSIDAAEVIHRMSRLEEAVERSGVSLEPSRDQLFSTYRRGNERRRGFQSPVHARHKNHDTVDQFEMSRQSRSRLSDELDPPGGPLESIAFDCYMLNGPTIQQRSYTSISESVPTVHQKQIASIDLERYFLIHMRAVSFTDTSKQRALDSAISRAKTMAFFTIMSAKPTKPPRSLVNFYDPAMFPSAELLHFMLQSISASVSMGYFLDIYTCVSGKEVQKMALDLIYGRVHGQTRIQSIICVNHFCYAFLTAFESEQSLEMQQHFESRRRRFHDNALVALDSLDVQDKPELTLLKALLAGAMLQQSNGQTVPCWKLIQDACRVRGALLAEHLPKSWSEFSSEEYCNIQLIFMKCYVFDVALSASLYQAPTRFKVLDLDLSILDPETPSHAMLIILLRCTDVHEATIRYTRAYNSSGQLNDLGPDRLRSLKGQMDKIKMNMAEIRSQPPHSDNSFLQYEWRCMDLWFCTTMASIITLGSSQNDENARKECLHNTRESFGIMKGLLDIAADSSPVLDKYLHCLTWFIPLFSLHPLCLLFGNALATSDASDLRLIRYIAQGLNRLGRAYPSFSAFKRVCEKLISLYTDLMGISTHEKQSEETFYESEENSAVMEEHSPIDDDDGDDGSYTEFLQNYPDKTSGIFSESQMSGETNPGMLYADTGLDNMGSLSPLDFSKLQSGLFSSTL